MKEVEISEVAGWKGEKTNQQSGKEFRIRPGPGPCSIYYLALL